MKIIEAWLRIIATWLAVLCVLGLVLGGRQGFAFIAGIFGAILTVPALFLLALVSEIESRLLRAGKPIASVLAGITTGLTVPVILYALAPNPDNARQGIFFFVALCGGTGLLWSLTSFLLLCRKGQSSSPPQAS